MKGDCHECPNCDGTGYIWDSLPKICPKCGSVNIETSRTGMTMAMHFVEIHYWGYCEDCDCSWRAHDRDKIIVELEE